MNENRLIPACQILIWSLISDNTIIFYFFIFVFADHDRERHEHMWKVAPKEQFFMLYIMVISMLAGVER